MSFWAAYSLFALKLLTFIVGIVLLLLVWVGIKLKLRALKQAGYFEITPLNQDYAKRGLQLASTVLKSKEKKQYLKNGSKLSSNLTRPENACM